MQDPSRRNILIALSTPVTAIVIGSGQASAQTDMPRTSCTKKHASDWRCIPHSEQIRDRSIIS